MSRLAVVTSHPIQYQAPWFRALAQVVDLEVFFCHRQDGAGQADAGFGRTFDWDIPLLDGYRYRWLRNVAPRPSVDRFSGCNTPEIADLLRDGGFDACLVSGWYLRSYVQAIRACWALRMPVLMRGDSHLATPRSGLKTAAKYLPYRWLLRHLDAHLYVGQANRAYLQHYGVADERLFFAPHFVDNDRFAESAARARASGAAAALRAAAGATPDAPMFLFAGKLVAHKRASDFIQALAGLRASGRVVHGLIVGSGPDEAALRELAGTLGAPVHFTGFRNQSEMPVCYAAADCLVLPSISETWGLVVNEAMACGLPAIVSDVAGSAEDLIETGATGYTYPAGGIPQLWDRMSEVASRLEQDRTAFALPVRRKIARYACDAAIVGTLQALEAVSPRVRPVAPEATPVFSRGDRS
ncbi:MAG TPA: glycosyltransferase family 4 protein [Vicinamibacterales bacterium]|nr:glycosyltransferase family 4 protein [Vicinamibacterales bacterium]